MSITAVIITIVLVIAVLAIAVVAWSVLRRRRLQQRFGPEYERQVATQPDRGTAERELRRREQRHAELKTRELSPEDRDRYTREWTELQAGFVEDPARAASSADELITRVMAARGYPTGDFDDRLSSLSVEHSRTLGNYRVAHEISEANRRGQASTEQLRQALVHYRALADDLLGNTGDHIATHSDQAKEGEVR